MDESHAQQDRQWHIVSRWQEYHAEIRSVYVRVFAIAAFYLVQLYDFLIRKATTLEVHRNLTLIAAAWIFASLFALTLVQSRRLPSWLKYVTVLVDVLLLTLTLFVTTGPQSPLLLAYPVILILASLRFSLRLIWTGTIGCLASYLAVLAGCHPNWFGTAERTFTVSRREELIVLLAIAVCGVGLGQLVRQVKRASLEYAERREEATDT